MSDLSKDFRRELTYKIHAAVALSEEGQQGMQMAASTASLGEEGEESGVDDKKGEGSDVDDMMFDLDEMDVYNEMKFDTVSWSFEDYRQAVQDESFFQAVRSVFPPYHESEDENEKAAKINELLERKYCVADFAQDSLDDVISSVGNRGVTSRLLAKYHTVSGCRGWYYNCLVSAYVARKLAVTRGFAMLERIASGCGVNTMNEWLFEGWFLSKLSRQGIEYVEEGLDQLQGQWGQSDVLFFDPTKATIGICLDRSTWLTPVQWNQGGYDAVFVDKPNELVRFVQVTRADHHSYDHRYFVELLDKLAVHNDWKDVQLKKVQLYFVVPREKLSVFRRPVQTADFQENVIQGPFSSLVSAAAATRTHVDFVFENCEAEVKTLGVDYEVSIY
ncbi:hypothetical protein PF010_g15457 [Phytophthora fragariae]|uniref:Uncharacterized protein n=2 Tax=Phytophthora fragariae TaxID=53985 RepID=A0A6G0KUW5_9STRA|nr:hypothetical protein PF010_g15457 [Phytophthora fragariae]